MEDMVPTKSSTASAGLGGLTPWALIVRAVQTWKIKLDPHEGVKQLGSGEIFRVHEDGNLGGLDLIRLMYAS